jgi:hypothetical protein
MLTPLPFIHPLVAVYFYEPCTVIATRSNLDISRRTGLAAAGVKQQALWD